MGLPCWLPRYFAILEVRGNFGGDRHTDDRCMLSLRDTLRVSQDPVGKLHSAGYFFLCTRFSPLPPPFWLPYQFASCRMCLPPQQGFHARCLRSATRVRKHTARRHQATTQVQASVVQAQNENTPTTHFYAFRRLSRLQKVGQKPKYLAWVWMCQGTNGTPQRRRQVHRRLQPIPPSTLASFPAAATSVPSPL